MARVRLIQNRDDIAPEHHALFDELAALRGRISGPSTVVLHSPTLAQPWNQISEYLHGKSIVQPQHAELAVCATARECDCPYIWNAHARLARAAGVSEASLTAVRDRSALEGLPAEEAQVASFARQLIGGNRVDDGLFAALLAAHGPRWLVELSAWIGRYSALAGILNAFEVPLPPDAELLPVEEGAAGVGSRVYARPNGPAPRFPQLVKREQVDASAHEAFDLISEGRGNVRGPWSLLMYCPPLALSVLDVSNVLRTQSVVSARDRELVTIATAREKDCPYVWAAHAPAARNEGVSEATIASVRDRAALDGLSAADRDIVQYARDLLQRHSVSQARFDRLREAHDEQWLVELTAVIGHYCFVTALLNAVEVSPAPGSEALPLG